MQNDADFELTGQIALGGASFSLPSSRDWDQDVASIRLAADLGIRVFDSARAYAPAGDPDHSERLFAAALEEREDVLIATKGGHYRVDETSWEIDNSPERLRNDVMTSLKNLGGPALPLFFLHRADGSPDLTQPLETLDSLRAQGLVLRIGLSNVTVEQLGAAMEMTQIDAVQNLHSAAGRDSKDVLALCEANSIPFLAYSPLRAGDGGGNEADFPSLHAYARETGLNLQALMLRSLLESSPMMSVITGASQPVSIRASAAAPRLSWTAEAAAAAAADHEARGASAAASE